MSYTVIEEESRQDELQYIVVGEECRQDELQCSTRGVQTGWATL
jgi:hypothetical protein